MAPVEVLRDSEFSNLRTPVLLKMLVPNYAKSVVTELKMFR